MMQIFFVSNGDNDFLFIFHLHKNTIINIKIIIAKKKRVGIDLIWDVG